MSCVRRSAAAALALALLMPRDALARTGHRASLHDRIARLEEEVQNVWQGLTLLADEYLPKAEDTDRAVWHAARGEFAWRDGESLRAAVHLLKSVRSPGFSEHEAYPEALYFLSEALIDLHMHEMARTLLEQALDRGARNRHFKEMLALFLEIAWGDHDPARLDGWVAAYRDRWMNRPRAAEADVWIRYHLGKVFIDRGQAAVARTLLAGVGQADPLWGRARYLVGVTYVMEGDHAAAAAEFEAAARTARKAERAARDGRAEAAWGPDPPEKSRRRMTTSRAVHGPTLEIPVEREVEVTVDPRWAEAAPAGAAEEVDQALALEAALSRARVAVLLDDYDAASAWYRRIPAGAPKYREALDEAVWAQIGRGQVARAEALSEELIASAPDGRGAGATRVLRAHLLAEAGRFDRAEEVFVETLARLEAAVPEVQAAGDGLLVGEDGTIAFDPRIAAWTEPQDLERAGRRIGLLNDRQMEVAATQGLVVSLKVLGDDPSSLPATREAHARSDGFRRQIEALRAAAETLRRSAQGRAEAAPARRGVGAGGDTVGPLTPALDKRLQGVEAWIGSLDQHLTFYLAAIDQDARRQAAEILKVVGEESARLEGIEAQVGTLHRESLAEARGLAAGAMHRLRDLEMKAQLGLTEVSYKRQDWITRRIDAMYKEKKADEAGLLGTRRQADATETATANEVAWPPGLARWPPQRGAHRAPGPGTATSGGQGDDERDDDDYEDDEFDDDER